MWKVLIIALLLFIIFSLFSALIFLIRDQGKGERVVRSLSWRIGLSLFLIAFIALTQHMGLVGGESGWRAPPPSQHVDQNE